MSDADRRLDPVARAQHGAFARPQALAAGFTDRMISRRLDAGRWLRLDTGIYALASHPFSWERQAMAATLSATGAVLAGLSAPALLGVDGFSRARLEIRVPRSKRTTRSALAVVRSGDDLPVTRIQNIPVLRPDALPFDLAGRISSRRLEKLVDELLARRLTTIDELFDLWVSFSRGRRTGSVALRPILEARRSDAYVPPTNELERLLFAACEHPSLPPVLRQVEMPWWPTGSGIVDGYAPSCRIILEADGRAWHTREADFERDRERDNLAAAHGHQVLRFTWTALSRQPQRCRAIFLRAAMARGWCPPK